MNTEREKIISLAKELGFIPRHVELDEHWKQVVESFYHASIADFLQSSEQWLTNEATCAESARRVRNEALEDAANRCEVLSCTAAGCVDALRAMKESK